MDFNAKALSTVWSNWSLIKLQFCLQNICNTLCDKTNCRMHLKTSIRCDKLRHLLKVYLLASARFYPHFNTQLNLRRYHGHYWRTVPCGDHTSLLLSKIARPRPQEVTKSITTNYFKTVSVHFIREFKCEILVVSTQQQAMMALPFSVIHGMNISLVWSKYSKRIIIFNFKVSKRFAFEKACTKYSHTGHLCFQISPRLSSSLSYLAFSILFL